MKNLYLLLFGLFAFGQMQAQSAGDLLFVAVNADDSDDITFVLLADFPANDTIFFTDEEWNGTAFNSPDLEGDNWWVNNQVTPAGTVVQIFDLGDEVNTSTSLGTTGAAIDPGGSTSTNVGMPDAMGLSASGDGIYAYTGDLRNPMVFVGAFTMNSWTAAQTLTGTGLTAGTNAFSGSGNNDDVYAYNGLRSGLASFGSYASLLSDPANWDIQNGSGSQTADGIAPDKPFDLTNFIATPVVAPIANIVITEIMYNSPGTDIEFLELYNNDVAAVDLTGYYFSQGVTYTFPSMTMNPGDYLLLTGDSLAFDGFYGMVAYEWTGGSLSNSGEDLILSNSTGITVDSVDYMDDSPWSFMADGRGPSLVLCDINSDNSDVANWQRATSYVADYECREVYANPSTAASCATNPIVTLDGKCVTYNEDDGTISVDLYIDNPNGMAIMVDVAVGMSSTAISGTDFNFTAGTVTFPAGTDTAQTITLDILDDANLDGDNMVVLALTNPTNGATIATDEIEITIIDDDAPVIDKLVLTGIMHGPNSGVPKAIELYVIQDIPNLSIFGIGIANNGGGTDGQEFTFPAVAASQGDIIYVANDTAAFSAFFGVHAHFEDAGVNFNGDDAVELFENGNGIDVFGDINVDGTGTTWEYALGWAQRVNTTGPDGETFMEANWVININALFLAASNSAATIPYPIGGYDYTTGTQAIDLSNNVRFYPNPVGNTLFINLEINVDYIQLTNMLGQPVRNISTPQTAVTMDVSDLSPGIYILSFVTKDGVWSKQIIVR